MRQRLEPFGPAPAFTWWDLLIALVACTAFLSLLTGCTTALKPLQTGTLYRYDMEIQINGAAYEGTAVVPRAAKYHFKVESQADMDMLTITSCSRETPVQAAIKQGWFSTRRGYEFDYVPNEIEKQGGCPLRLGGYDKKNGRHSWALIDFEGDEKLAAGITCNGQAEFRVDGVGICQSHEGLEQKIRFVTPVDIAVDSQDPGCRLPEPADGKTWRFNMPKGVCTHAFMERAGKGEVLRITTIGYDQIVIRE